MAFAFCSLAEAQAPTLIFVDGNSPAGSPDGTTWDKAFQDLQDALDIADSTSTILLADGTYSPNPTNSSSTVLAEVPGGPATPRHSSFIFKKPTTVIGGFLGYDPVMPGTTDPNNPDASATSTVMTGDAAGTPFNIRDNSHHVFYLNGAADTDFAIAQASLQRMVIKYGYAHPDPTPTPLPDSYSGAGIFAKSNVVLNLKEVQVTNCYAGFRGAGAYFKSSAARAETCLFENNIAYDGGGGLHLDGHQDNSAGGENAWKRYSQIHNVQFRNNSALSGGGICAFGNFYHWLEGANEKPGLSVANCLFLNNTGGAGGGAHLVLSESSRIAWVNCTFTGNRASGISGPQPKGRRDAAPPFYN